MKYLLENIQTVYLPAKVEEASGNYIPDKSVLLVKEQDEMDIHWIDLVHQKQGYFFTTEQLNEYTANVIKRTLETAAEKSKIKREETHEIVFKGFSGGNPSYGNKEIITCDKQSITNTFEETFQKYKI